MADNAESHQLTDSHWNRLIKIIGAGKCILLLGPDVATDPSGDDPVSLSQQLAQRLADQLPESPAGGLDTGDLAHVAQAYRNLLRKDRTDLESEVEMFYEPYQGQRNPIHDDLAALPFKLCITTTPDDFLGNALRTRAKQPRTEYYHFREGRPDRIGTSNAEQPLVYQLFGSLTDSSSLVLTETDLLDFLVNVIAGTPELPPALISQFREHERETSFLFVGFGFQRWYLRVLLHLLRKQLPNSSARSLALEDGRFFANPEHEKTTLFYHHAQALEFRQCSWRAFASELRRRFEQKQAAPVGDLVPEPPADAPTVFLCHSSTDREAVEAFAGRLRQKGLNTWRDRDELRGGDDWDRRLKHVIAKQVDYVLVMQSPTFFSKTESYFFKEINAAMERQTGLAVGLTFVIPAFFLGEGEYKLQELEMLNYIDLRTADGLSRLVQDIQADQRKRRERAHAA